MCVCVCVYVYVCLCMCLCVCDCTYAFVFVFVYIYVCAYVYVYTCVFMGACVYVWIFTIYAHTFLFALVFILLFPRYHYHNDVANKIILFKKLFASVHYVHKGACPNYFGKISVIVMLGFYPLKVT